MILDALVEERLSDGRIVDFAVAVAAVTDDVHDDVAAEGRTIFRGKFSGVHDRVRVFGVDGGDRQGLAFCDSGGEGGRSSLRGVWGKGGQVVKGSVNGA